MGPQQRFFGENALAAFATGPWHMTDAWDRMGVRLIGPLIAPNATLDMPSEPIVRGSVQVAGDGVASILFSDHQTTGGYPKIATVLDCDIDALVQLRPRDGVAFRPVSPQDAIAIARASIAADQRHQRAISQARGSLDWRLRSENLIGGAINAKDAFLT
jgi:allophanate hydrolase